MIIVVIFFGLGIPLETSIRDLLSHPQVLRKTLPCISPPSLPGILRDLHESRAHNNLPANIRLQQYRVPLALWHVLRHLLRSDGVPALVSKLKSKSNLLMALVVAQDNSRDL